MNGFIGVNEIVIFSKMEIVEVVCLENRLYFAVLELLAFLIKITVGLDNGAVPLALAEKNEMVLADCVEGLAALVTDNHLA